MKNLLVAIFFISTSTLSYAKPIELTLWHSLAGYLGGQFNQLTEQFNQSQSDYRVKLVYKGEYTDSLTSFASAFRAGQPPTMIQAQEVATAVLLNPPGIIKPLEDLLAEAGSSLPEEHFLPAIKTFYSKQGKLQALPFNISVPVLYYNADALAQMGVDAKNFPNSWQALGQLIKKLRKSGYACGYTSAYPSWVHIEAFSALNDLTLIDEKQNRVHFNTPILLKHLSMLKRWHKTHYFQYGGRRSEATILFTSGRCVFFSQSSGSYNSLASSVKFKLGVHSLAFDGAFSHANVPGGGAIWAVSGQSLEIYKGIAGYFSFIAKPEIQLQWHLGTGYIPLGLTGDYAKIRKKSTHPALAIAVSDLINEKGRYLSYYPGPQNQIRNLTDEALEEIFSGQKTPEQALADVVKRANYLVGRFRTAAG